MEKLIEILKNKIVKSWLQIAISIILITGFVTFCISSAKHNNYAPSTYESNVVSIAEKHNEKVDELVAEDALLTKPTYYIEESRDIRENATEESPFIMTILDVGQASCALITCDGQTMVFDGGDRDTSSYVYSYLTNTKGINYFDYVVASHYDSDHIAGLIGLLKKQRVGIVFGAPYVADTKTYKSFEDAANLHGGIVYPEVGSSFWLGSALCTVVSPVDELYTDENGYSLGLLIDYYDTSFLIMGDATVESELDSVNSGLIRHADVFVVNHHGSSSSSCSEFVNAVSPDVAVISVVRNNDYGHPTQEVLSRLEGVPIYRTDINGNIEITSDGEEITITVEQL